MTDPDSQSAPSTMAKKLQYFDWPGLAEGIRYILHYTGQEFQDHRHEFNTWPNIEVKKSLPYGQIPLYEEGDRVLHQSLAIARYLAANTPLLPTDPWEQAQLDAAVLTLYDYFKHVVVFTYEKDPKRKEEFEKKLFEETIDYYFSRFEKQVKENNGFIGKKLSWADCIFVAIIETSNLFLKTNIEKNYPAITKLIETVKNSPGIKEYVQNRKPYYKK